MNSNNKTIILAAITAISALGLLAGGEVSADEEIDTWSIFAYGGKWSDNRIGEIIQGRTKLRSSYVWVGGVSRKVHDFNDDLQLEMEFNVARHSGKQDHYEFNAAASLRWQSFPWDRYVNSTLSYGLGPSYAERRPPIEQRSDRDPTHVLVFMPVEITFGPPEKYDLPWEVLLRVHHRSGAYGVVSDAGGSNIISTGLRFRF